MSVSRRFAIVLLLICLVGGSLLYRHFRTDLDTRYREAVEENMVDHVQMIASLLSEGLSLELLNSSMNQLEQRRFSAKIYDLVKTHSNSLIYVTDSSGVVLYHSAKPEDIGVDYSNWRDVYLSLNGQYGARTTRVNPEDSTSSVLYVAAPILEGDKIAGVVSLGKPTKDFLFFLSNAQQKLFYLVFLTFGLMVLLGILAGFWVIRPLVRIRRYASEIQNTRRGEQLVPRSALQKNSQAPPKAFDKDLQYLGDTLHDLRKSLGAKEYVEKYVQVLTHELKSPISAILGASEILETNPPEETRQKFIGNIRQESERMQNLVGNILEVAALERKEEVENLERLNLAVFCRELRLFINPLLESHGAVIKWPGTIPEAEFEGDPFLLKHALSNLIQNSLDHLTGEAKRTGLSLEVENTGAGIVFRVLDQGEGIPEYALERIFEKFYSLPKPGTGKKGTGLGLAFASEVARLHHGALVLQNRPDGGVEATFQIYMT